MLQMSEAETLVFDKLHYLGTVDLKRNISNKQCPCRNI